MLSVCFCIFSSICSHGCGLQTRCSCSFTDRNSKVDYSVEEQIQFSVQQDAMPRKRIAIRHSLFTKFGERQAIAEKKPPCFPPYCPLPYLFRFLRKCLKCLSCGRVPAFVEQATSSIIHLGICVCLCAFSVLFF
jgi:hypothetical protein